MDAIVRDYTTTLYEIYRLFGKHISSNAYDKNNYWVMRKGKATCEVLLKLSFSLTWNTRPITPLVHLRKFTMTYSGSYYNFAINRQKLAS